MTYVIPSLQTLLNDIDSLRDEYTRNRIPPNPARLELISSLEAAKATLVHLSQQNNPPPEEVLQEIMLGCYLFVVEHIHAEYRLLNPEHKKGYIFNSGSYLYKGVLTRLGISTENNLDDHERLYYLSRFYNHMFKTYKGEFKDNSTPKGLTYATVKAQVATTLRSAFENVVSEATKLKKSIPTEPAIDLKMQAMPDNYRDKCQDKKQVEDPKRKLLARLIKATSEMLPEDPEDDAPHYLSRTQRIKMGFLLYVTQIIWDSYTLRSPEGNSALYDLCREALNIQKIDDMDPRIRLECITAFESFLEDSNNRKILETRLGKMLDEGERKIAIDPTAKEILAGVKNIIGKLTHQQSSGISSVTIGMAIVGGLLAASPGYGAGWAIGWTLSKTGELVNPKVMVSELTGKGLTVILGSAGNHLGYFASDMFIDATLERAFAKLFEGLSMMVGAATGGLIGLVVFDLSYKTLRALSRVYMDLYAKLDPLMAKDFDPKFVMALLELPEDIFSKEDKLKVKAITQGRFFTQPQASDVDVLPLHPSSSSSVQEADRHDGNSIPILSLSRSH